jgi:hypothetical protein
MNALDNTTIFATLGGAVAGAVLTLFGIKRQIKAEIRAALHGEIETLVRRQDLITKDMDAIHDAEYMTEKAHDQICALRQRVLDERFSGIHQLLSGQKEMLEHLNAKIERLLARP